MILLSVGLFICAALFGLVVVDTGFDLIKNRWPSKTVLYHSRREVCGWFLTALSALAVCIVAGIVVAG